MTRIGSGYSAYSIEAVAELFSVKKYSSSPKKPTSPSSKTNILLEPPSQNAVINKIEKHISDIKKGYGNNSRDVANLIAQQDSSASSLLAQSNPRIYAMYSGYLSGLRYDRAARFVNGVEYGLNQMAQFASNSSAETEEP